MTFIKEVLIYLLYGSSFTGALWLAGQFKFM